jgi:hypothetical protein
MADSLGDRQLNTQPLTECNEGSDPGLGLEPAKVLTLSQASAGEEERLVGIGRSQHPVTDARESRGSPRIPSERLGEPGGLRQPPGQQHRGERAPRPLAPKHADSDRDGRAHGARNFQPDQIAGAVDPATRAGDDGRHGVDDLLKAAADDHRRIIPLPQLRRDDRPSHRSGPQHPRLLLDDLGDGSTGGLKALHEVDDQMLGAEVGRQAAQRRTDRRGLKREDQKVAAEDFLDPLGEDDAIRQLHGLGRLGVVPLPQTGAFLGVARPQQHFPAAAGGEPGEADAPNSRTQDTDTTRRHERSPSTVRGGGRSTPLRRFA